MARNIFTKGTAITLAWHFTKPDGTSFDLSGYQLRLFYGVGSRYTEVSDYTLGTNASNELEDFITWTFAADKQVTAGDYKMKLQIYQNGHLFTTMNYNNAFSLFQGTPYSSNDEQQEEEANVVNLYTAAEFYLFNPIVPTVGTDGYWYVNGVLVLDGDDNPIPSFYNVVYDESTRWLSIYKGDQTDPHNPDPEPVQVIKDVDNALKHWQEQYETEEGSRAESVAGDGSRWGSYKTAETNRNAAYAEEEGSLAGSTAADDDRWGKYKLAEDLRDTAYAEQEGTAASEAGSNDRWGKYKTAEAARNTARETAEGSSSSTAGDGSRWGAYKTAENERDAARATVEGTNASAAGDGTRWGAYKTAENNRDSARLAAEGDSSSTAGDGSRWGSYKSAEANRDTARETAEGTAASEAGDGTRWGSYKTAEASRNTAYAGEEGTLAGSTAADNDRWGKYKAAEAARETAYETAEGDATAEAGDANRWGAYKTAEAARGTAFDSAEATRNAGMAPLVGIFDCSTAAATAQKEVAASNYVLANGGAFKVKFTYANSASSPTLKINSETAKAIVFNGAEASADNTWGAGEVVEFYYDPSYDSNTGGFIGRSSVISVSQNTETGKEELKIGNTAALVIDNEPEAGSNSLAKSGGVFDFVNLRASKGRLLSDGLYQLKHIGIKNHLYTLCFNNVEDLDYTYDGNILGIHVQYQDYNEYSVAVFAPTDDIPSTISFLLNSHSTPVEYIRISARVANGKYVDYVLNDVTDCTNSDYKEKVDSKRGYTINPLYPKAVELTQYVNRVSVQFVGTSYSSNVLYKPNGKPRKIAFRGYGVGYSSSPTGKRAVIYKEQDDGSMASWASIYNDMPNNRFYGIADGFKIILDTNGWSASSIGSTTGIPNVTLEQVNYISNDLFINAVKIFESKSTCQVLPDNDTLNANDIVISNSVGDWTLRYPDIDSIVKNVDGSFRVTLQANVSPNRNHAFWLLNTIPQFVIGKRVLLKCKLKVSSGSLVNELRYIINETSAHSVILSEDWLDFTYTATFEAQYEDNRVMFYNINTDNSIIFDIADVSLVVLSDIDKEQSDAISALQADLDSSVKEIYRPFANAFYKFADIEKNSEGQAIIALLGDSWTQHSGASDLVAHSNYVQPLTKYLRTRYGNAGGGYYSFSCSHNGTAKMGCADPDDANDVRTGTIVYRDQVEGCKGVDAADATFEQGASLTLNVLTNHDKFIIHYYGESTAGIFRYKIDSGDWVNIDASESDGHTTIEATTTDATHVIVFEIVSGSVMLFGVDMQRTSCGVRVHKIANKGAKTESYVIVDTVCWQSIFESLNIDSMTILLGVNDGADATTSVENNLKTIVNNIRGVNPYIDVTIVMPSSTKTRNLTNQSKYQYAAAKDLDVGYLSLMDLFGPAAKIIAKGTFYDDLHPTTIGGRMISDYMIKKLLLPSI